MKEALSTCW